MITQVKNQAIQIPDAPALPGLTFRRWRDATDFEPIAAIMNANNAADQINERFSAEAQANFLSHLSNSEPARDIVCAEVNGEMVAYLATSWTQEDDGTRLYPLRGNVHPNWRRRGIGRALLRYGEQHQREIASTHPRAGKRLLASFAADTAIGKVALLQSEGYAPVRYFYVMVVPLEPIPASVTPAGLEIRPVKKEHYRQLFAAVDEAFRDHWGHTQATEANYEMWLRHSYFDDSLFVVAWDGDQIAGASINLINADENRANNYTRGWVDDLAVRRPWRKRGLGRALLIESMRVLKSRGITHAQLAVDTENPTGALHLYEAVGFRAESRMASYRKEMK